MIATRWLRSNRSLGLWLVVLLVSGCQHARSSPPAGPAAERVPIGYGVRSPTDETGAVASATADEMANVTSGRVEELLAARFAGVDVTRLPSGDYSIRIRGARSFMGGNEPLVVIDGIPSPVGLGNPLRDLSPRDVARIDVLKDAAATAIYGARGANGVILISTSRSFD